MRISDWSSDVCSSDLLVIDKPGVIADVAAALRDENISMESVIQRGRAEGEGEAVPVIIMTHDTKEAQIQRALARTAELAVVVEQPRLSRIVDRKPPALPGSAAASQVGLPLHLQFTYP